MITKKLSPKGRSVRVKFVLPEPAADRASIVGNFNGWDASKHEMKFNQKDGVFEKEISFKPGERLEFRYLVDGEWRNDEAADSYEPSGFCSDNCVVEL
ncbi:MAG: isoamylase early set domain-containing protein [Bacteroidetes bacterium]|nr:isoamylase early set domain-containing protein [Bacteroidota bacterium]